MLVQKTFISVKIKKGIECLDRSWRIYYNLSLLLPPEVTGGQSPPLEN